MSLLDFSHQHPSMLLSLSSLKNVRKRGMHLHTSSSSYTTSLIPFIAKIPQRVVLTLSPYLFSFLHDPSGSGVRPQHVTETALSRASCHTQELMGLVLPDTIDHFLPGLPPEAHSLSSFPAPQNFIPHVFGESSLSPNYHYQRDLQPLDLYFISTHAFMGFHSVL